MKFRLTINLGNAGMSTSEHVANALRAVAKRVENNEYVETCEDDMGELITRGIDDDNGNRVGEWSLCDEETSMETPE